MPFLPIAMVSFFKWQPVPSFLLGIVVGLWFTHNLSSYSLGVEKLQKTLYDGVADSGLLIGMLYSVNIFQAAAKQVAPYLQHLLGGVIPTSPTALLIGFCILAPLALFRGPLMIWGSGIALVTILQAMGTFDEMFLFALFLIPPVAMVASACPTQLEVCPWSGISSSIAVASISRGSRAGPPMSPSTCGVARMSSRRSWTWPLPRAVIGDPRRLGTPRRRSRSRRSGPAPAPPAPARRA